MKTKNILIFLILFYSFSFAQTTVSVNPGIKMGFSLGGKSEFNFGYELSIVFFNMRDPDYKKYGIVFDYDTINEINKLHIGFEFIYRFVGIDIGPTFGWKNDDALWGYSVIPFGGALIFPYYNFTHFFNGPSIHELGTYIKIPIGDFGGGRLN